MKRRNPAFLLALLLAAAPVFAAEVDIGPWRLGMSKEQVVALAEQGPYTDLAETGGLETKSGKFNGKKADTAFAFADGTLRSIEVRVYEGKVWNKAKDAALDVYDEFVANYGGASVKDVSAKVDRKEMEKILDRTLGTAQEMNKQYAARERAIVVAYDMAPLRQPADSRLHCQWIYLGKSDTYMVFFYQDLPGTKSRDAEESIVIEKL